MQPTWLDRTLYPFKSRTYTVPEGRLHYIDEGSGEPIVLLHGNPTWSFMFRHIVTRLAPSYRCLAPDYLGFGLSDKPSAWTYLPEDHARHVQAFLLDLDLQEVTLVMHDWGGPIGMAVAMEDPSRIKRLIVMNTWMWPVQDDWHFWLFSKAVGGPLGRVLIERANIFATQLMPRAFADPARLTPAVHDHYIKPLARAKDRKACAVLPKAIVKSSPWLARIWNHRHLVQDKPMLLLWGMKDRAFRPQELARWMEVFPHARVQRLKGIGHYVPEEGGVDVAAHCQTFLEST